MKKKALIAAVGAALVAGPIAAQAAATVYGHAHWSFDALTADRSGTGIEDSSNQVVSNSSRFGITGSEDLGGGLKAEAKYELLFVGNDTTSGIVTTNRDQYLGLAGGFGAIRLGVIDSATKDVGGVADLFYREQLGESRAIINSNGNAMDNRVQNGVHYFSPSLGGFVIKAQYGYDTEQTIGAATNDITRMSLGVKGKIAMVTLGVAYTGVARGAAGANDTTGYRAAAKATFGPIDVAALYQSVSDIGGTASNDQDAYGAGVGFKFGNNYIKGQYYATNDLGNISNSAGSQISVGYDYIFSKTTLVYVTYAKVDSDGTVFYSVGGNGHGTSATPNVSGGSASGISVGMIMNF